MEEKRLSSSEFSMLRCAGCLLLWVATMPLVAQDWRPVSAIPPAASGITLGKPRLKSSEVPLAIQPLPRDAVLYQTRKYGDLDKLPPPPFEGFSSPTTQTGYQGPGSSAEEAFNCGQVPGQAPAGGAAPPPPGGAPYYGQPPGGAPAPYYGQPGGPPPPPGGPPPGGASPWYQPIKDCWNRIFGGGSSNSTGIPGTWDARSDQAFKDFISPMTNVNFFEDPRSLTEFRFIGTYQKAPSDNILLDGGQIFDFNLQGRISINDNWSLILHRLGFANVKPGGAALGGYSGGSGLTDIQLGAKYTFLRDTRSETLLAAGFSFEIPIGSDKVLSGTGAGITPYLSYGQGFLNDWHFLATTGYRFGISGGSSDFFFLSTHLDYGFFKRFYPLVELNWYYYTSNGNRQPVDFEGGNLFNIGATGISGKSLITLAGGFRFKFSEAIQTGIIYEMPIVGTSMLEKYRISLDLIFRY
jgi:hypothetical protein